MVIMHGWIVLGALGGLAVMQSVFVWLHCRFVRSRFDISGDYQPSVAVLLCLRGSDPSLTQCLQGLINQSHNKFTIHLVVDSESDAALHDAQRFLVGNDWSDFEVHVVKDHSKNCSLKCSAIVTAILEINDTVVQNQNHDDSAEVIALIDADAVADPNWLRDLVSPLEDPKIGVSTGNRWFSPASLESLGSEVRKAWNAAAVPQMTFYQIPWGGSLAIRRSTIADCELLEKWSHAFCEDTMLTGVMKKNGLRMARVPNLILSNDESTSLSGAYHWIVRQLLTVRLHNRDWQVVLIHAFFCGLVLVAVPTSIAALVFIGKNSLALTVLVGFLLFQACNYILISAIESANLAAIESRGRSVTRSRFSQKLMSILLTQLLHPIAAIDAALTKKVSWRSIDYKILSGKKIEMVEYHPFDDSERESESIA